MIGSDLDTEEASHKVLELTRAKEELRSESSLHTGRFLDKRRDSFDFNLEDANLFKDMEVGLDHEFETITNMDPTFWLRRFDRVGIKGRPPEKFGSGARIELLPSENTEFDAQAVTVWYVAYISVDEEGTELVKLQYSHTREEEEDEAHQEAVRVLEEWTLAMIKDGSGFMTLAWIGLQWRLEHKDQPTAKEVVRQSGYRGLKDFFEKRIEPNLGGELMWLDKDDVSVSVALKGDAVYEEDDEVLVWLWLSSNPKVPEDPEVAAHTYNLVQQYIVSTPEESPHLWQGDIYGEMGVTTFIKINWPPEISVNSVRHVSFGWMVHSGALAVPHKNADEFEMLKSTVLVLKTQKTPPPHLDKSLVYSLVDQWAVEVQELLPGVIEYRRKEKEHYWSNVHTEDEYEVSYEEEVAHEQEYQDIQRANEKLSRIAEEQQAARSEAEEKRKQEASERAFEKEYGSLASPRRVADLLNALDDEPSDLGEFSELVKASYKRSTAAPWTRLPGRDKMLKFVWSCREESPGFSPVELILHALQKAGKTSEEADAILSEASAYKPD